MTVPPGPPESPAGSVGAASGLAGWLPESFLSHTRVAWEGAAGREWAHALPGLVRRACDRWGLRVAGQVMHGANGVAVPVVCEGVPCVLKVAWPDQELQDQVLGLRLWSGHGMVRLLEAELDDGALLLERLDMTCTLRSQPVTEALTVAGELLGRLSVPAARDGEAADGLATLPTCPEVADAFLQSADERAAALGHPVPAAVLAMAQRLARGLTDVDSDRLLNADLHDENILAAAREPWLAIDPRVMIGVPEYGIAQLLWWRLEDIENDLGLRRAFDLLVSVAQLDAELARAWTIVRSVDYWLWGRANGLTIDPVRCARVVDGLA